MQTKTYDQGLIDAALEIIESVAMDSAVSKSLEILRRALGKSECKCGGNCVPAPAEAPPLRAEELSTEDWELACMIGDEIAAQKATTPQAAIAIGVKCTSAATVARLLNLTDSAATKLLNGKHTATMLARAKRLWGEDLRGGAHA